jgi:formylglycine-generating enzyme required for sulfatase activity
LLEDLFDQSGYEGAPDDGSAWIEGGANRVVRGGYWNSGPGDLRAAGRSFNSTVGRGNSLGFRVARTLTP